MAKPPAFPKRTISEGSVSIDLMGDHVKVAWVKEAQGELKVQTLAEKKFPENADAAIAAYLAACYKEWRIKKKQAICLIPSKLFISKNIDMPSKDPEEIRKIVDLQAHRYTPYSRDEIVIDYLCMETPGQHYTNVLLIIVNRKVTDRYTKIFDQAGIEIEKIAIAPEGMAQTYQMIAGAEFESEALCGLHISSDFSDFTITDKKQVVFVRNISIGGQQLKANFEEAQAEFLKQLNKSIVAYQNQGVGRAAKGLIVTGLLPDNKALEEGIKTQIPYIYASNIPVKMVKYETFFKLGENQIPTPSSGEEVSYFELLSCLASRASLKVDLLPKEIKLKRKFRQGGKDIIRLGVVIMTFFVVISLFLASRTYFRKVQSDQLSSLTETSGEEAQALEKVSTKSRFLRSLLESRGKGLYAFEKMASFIGPDLYLSEFRYEDTGEIHIAGTAESMSRIFAFVTSLEESNYFTDVKTAETKSRKEGQKDVADFQIDCVMKEIEG